MAGRQLPALPLSWLWHPQGNSASKGDIPPMGQGCGQGSARPAALPAKGKRHQDPPMGLSLLHGAALLGKPKIEA